MPAQLQCAFDACKLPVNDRVSFSRVFELARGCALDSSSLPVVSSLCNAWLQRARSSLWPAECVQPGAAAVKELLPASIDGAHQAWGIQPHQSSSGWMSTWRVWRAVASALNMSGVLSLPPPNHVCNLHASPHPSLPPASQTASRVANSGNFRLRMSPLRRCPCPAAAPHRRPCFPRFWNQDRCKRQQQQQQQRQRQYPLPLKRRRFLRRITSSKKTVCRMRT